MRELLIREIGKLACDVGIVAVFVLPLVLIGFFIHRKKAYYKAEASEPFTELPLRPPGESLRLKIEGLSDQFDEAMITMGLSAAVASTLVITNPKSWPTWLGAGIIAGVSYIFCGRKLVRVTRTLWDHRLGFKGERAVGRELNQLIGLGYRVFHDLPFDGFNIDHVFVGPSGVYCVETKTRRKPARFAKQPNHIVVFDGKTLRFPWGHDTYGLAQAERNGRTLAKWLTQSTGERVMVQSILTLPGWWVERKGVSEVTVLNSKEFRSLIIGRKGTLSSEQIQRIAFQLTERCRLKEA